MSYSNERPSIWQRLGRCYPLSLELIPLFLLGLTVYLVAANYSSLPDTIPTHFGVSGTADDWGSKSTIFLLPALAVPLYFLMSVFNAWFALVKDPKSLINLPGEMKARLTDTQAEEVRTFTSRSLFAMKTVIEGMMAYLVYMTIQVANGEVASLGAYFFLFLGAILVIAGLLIWKAFSLIAGL